MKTIIDYRLPLIFIGGILFQYLFWDEFLGTNLFVFTIFTLGVTLSDSALLLNKRLLFIATSHLAIAAYLVYNNTALAITTWFISLLVYLGSIHFIALKSVGSAFLFGLLQLLSGVIGLAKKLQSTKLGKLNYQPFLKTLKYIIAPLILIVVFCSLYAIASPTFDKYISYFTDTVRSFFKTIFDLLFVDISFAKCGVILLGCLITAGAIVSIKSKLLETAELNLYEQLVRKRRDFNKITFGYEMRTLFLSSAKLKNLALKTENTIGIISFGALNILLALLNTIDITSLWFGNPKTDVNYSAALHDGTNTLIFSIVIAMMVILYFFSGNLNFYRSNKAIKTLAYIWIAQNTFLVASVLLRDYYYVLNHGLTYKRIGVAIFATLCIIGLYTVWVKIAKQKTLFYLYKANTLMWYCILITLSFINWDVLIVKYNLNNANKINIDVHHLRTFSGKTLPILIENKARILKAVSADADRKYRKDIMDTISVKLNDVKLSDDERKAIAINKAVCNYEDGLKTDVHYFVKKHSHQSWLSYSYLEAEALQLLKRSTKP